MGEKLFEILKFSFSITVMLSGIFFSHKADTLGILKDFCLRKDYDCSYTSKAHTGN